MLHFDLPWDPVELEQRIGRLDRIGRTEPVEILYFRHAEGAGDGAGDGDKGGEGGLGAGPDLAQLYERLDLFERPGAGLETALSGARSTLRDARDAGSALDVDTLVTSVEAARAEAHVDAAEVLYVDGYTAEQASDILQQVPEDLGRRTQAFCVEAAEDLGFECLEKGGAVFYIEFGSGAKIDALPGVEGGSRFLGSFDREEAVAKEEIDFFASGHALVEGLLLELEDGNRGRAALLELPAGSVATGLVCVYKDGPDWQLSIVEADGTPRPEWNEKFLKALPSARRARPEQWGISAQWADGLRALADRAKGKGELVAAAFFRPSGNRKR
jgi:ATP-dependent helicase HepA